jgi:hypothetical protein
MEFTFKNEPPLMSQKEQEVEKLTVYLIREGLNLMERDILSKSIDYILADNRKTSVSDMINSVMSKFKIKAPSAQRIVSVCRQHLQHYRIDKI